MKMKRRMFVLLGVAVLLTATLAAAAAAAPNQVTVHLNPVGGSGVNGVVDLRQLSPSGTHIAVTAKGLKPHSKHVSLYYDNHVCRFEPYSKDDVIGGNSYKANGNGVGRTSGNVDDNLDKINSVSVRDALTFRLLACADVHP